MSWFPFLCLSKDIILYNAQEIRTFYYFSSSLPDTSGASPRATPYSFYMNLAIFTHTRIDPHIVLEMIKGRGDGVLGKKPPTKNYFFPSPGFLFPYFQKSLCF